MKWLFSIGLTIFIFLSQPAISTASLTHLSGGGQDVVWDQTYNNYWYWDLSNFINMSWEDQKSAVEGLNTSSYYGRSDWHIATLADMEKLWQNSAGDLVTVFNPSQSYADPQFDIYHDFYDGRYDNVTIANLHYLATIIHDTFNSTYEKKDLLYTQMADWGENQYVGVWATASAPPVPIPGAVWLFGGSLVGIFGVRRKLKK